MNGGLGDRSMSCGLDCTPQQVRQTASEQTARGVGEGAGHPNFSTPKNVVRDCGGENGGNGCNTGGGGGRVRRGKGGTPCVSWTKDERKVLWECFELSGGVKRGGYIKRTKELFDNRNLTPRSGPSLSAQLKGIEGGGLTKMERDEIAKKVKVEMAQEENRGDGEEEVPDWMELFGESYDGDYEFRGFEDDESEDRREENDDGQGDEEVDANNGIEADVAEGDGPQDINARVERVEAADMWKDSNGTVRMLTADEQEVLALLRKVQEAGTWEAVPNLRAADRKKVMKEVEMVEGVMHNLVRDGMNVSEVNRLLYAGGVVVAMRLGLKTGKGRKADLKKPFWQRRIETNIKMWQKHLSQVEEIRKGGVLKAKARGDLERKYQLTERGTLGVSTFLKSKIQAGSTKIRWFVEKKVARRQNNLFSSNQSQLYKELGGDTPGGTNEKPDAAESREFWKSIWSVETEHDGQASWLEETRKKMEQVRAQEDVVISIEDVKAGIRRMTNWKAPGPEGVRGFWFKKLRSLHAVLTEALKECVATGEVPDWMVKGRTALIQKDPAKGQAVSNYRPIACLPLMWKLLTGIFAEKIYDHLQENSLLPEEQKGCRKRSRGTKDQLLIDKAVLREARVKKRFLAMAWIDYRKAYDMLPHSWILESLGLVKVAKNIEDLLRGSMRDWKTMLMANGESLGEVDIRRGIFQGDSLSPLLFVVAMIPLTLLLRREALGYRFGREGKKINHLLYMDDLKLYGKNRGEVEMLVEVVHVFSRDIGMEFGLDKCAVLEIKAGVKAECDGIELPDGKMIKEAEEKGYKYLGVLEGAGIKTKEMKEIVRKEYLRRVKLVAKSKLYAGNMMRAVNTWAVSVVRYTAGILDWSDAELKAMDVKTRKILTMNGVFHMRSSVDRLYMKRKDGGRGLISVKQCVRSEEAGLHEYIAASEEWMLKEVAADIVMGESKVEYKKRVEKERAERLAAKKLHGKFFREVKEVADERSWQWLKGGYLDKRNEGFVCAAQENVLKTRCYVATVMKQGGDVNCRLCGKYAETVGHLVSGCEKLAQREYRRRHDKMGLRVYWELCGKYGLKRSERWYEEVPDAVRKSADGRIEVRWDQKLVTPTALEANRPDVVVVDKVNGKWTLVDFSVPFDRNVVQKEEEKLRKYDALAAQVRRQHRVRTDVVPIVVGALGVVSKRLDRWLNRLGIGDVVGGLQTSAIIGTAAIVRKVLGNHV